VSEYQYYEFRTMDRPLTTVTWDTARAHFEYEQATLQPASKTSGRKMLKLLCQEHKMNTRQLGELLDVDQSIGTRILSGERSITVEYAKKLGHGST
jgi:antitoxin component HigA of HigAB toxin-antitoxin module